MHWEFMEGMGNTMDMKNEKQDWYLFNRMSRVRHENLAMEDLMKITELGARVDSSDLSDNQNNWFVWKPGWSKWEPLFSILGDKTQFQKEPSQPEIQNSTKLSERRHSLRVPLEKRVLIFFGPLCFRGSSKDISMGGMRTEAALPDSFHEQEFKVMIGGTGNEKVTANGKLVNQGDSSRICFSKIDEASETALRGWMAEAAPQGSQAGYLEYQGGCVQENMPSQGEAPLAQLEAAKEAHKNIKRSPTMGSPPIKVAAPYGYRDIGPLSQSGENGMNTNTDTGLKYSAA
jgi:hypothetical protein